MKWLRLNLVIMFYFPRQVLGLQCLLEGLPYTAVCQNQAHCDSLEATPGFCSFYVRSEHVQIASIHRSFVITIMGIFISREERLAASVFREYISGGKWHSTDLADMAKNHGLVCCSTTASNPTEDSPALKTPVKSDRRAADRKRCRRSHADNLDFLQNRSSTLANTTPAPKRQRSSQDLSPIGSPLQLL